MNDIKTIKIPKGEVLCRQGDKDTNLYLVTAGKLLICTRSGRMVTPLAYIEENQYFGEMSFFDALPRSADVLAQEDTTLVRIPNKTLKDQVPNWLHILAKSMTHKLRVMDSVISDKGIRKDSHEIKPLSIEEQRDFYQKLSADPK